MAVRAEHRRDQGLLRSGLEDWLVQRWNAAAGSRITAMTSFQEGGLSNETFAVDVSTPEGAVTRLVFRFPPVGEGVFQTYDLAREQAVLAALGRAGLAVAHPATFEPDHCWVGEPFLAMPLLAGRVPASQPRPYPEAGWLFECSVPAQRKVIDGFTDLLADLHGLNWREHGLEVAARNTAPSLGAEFTWWQDYFSWASQDLPQNEVSDVRAVFDWCADNLPTEEPPLSILWGDARLGNVVFDDEQNVVGALDFEIASIGPAELDLGWHLAHRRNMAERLHLAALPELRGFPDRITQLHRYEQRLGRKLAPLGWYELLGAAALGSCRLAVQRASMKAGVEPLGGRAIRTWALDTIHRKR